MTRRGKAKPPLRLRAKLWIERDGGSILSEAGADLLDQIGATGSLSEAARVLRYSYRRAWLLVDGMNKAWDVPLVETAVGGKRGGGARLTDLGDRVLRGFRDLQLQLEATIDRETAAFVKSVRP